MGIYRTQTGLRYSRGKTDGLDEVIIDGRSGEFEQHDVILRYGVGGKAVVRVHLDLGHSNVLTDEDVSSRQPQTAPDCPT